MSKQLEKFGDDKFGKFESADLKGIAAIRGGATKTSTTCEKTIETCEDKDASGENNDTAFS